MAFLMVQISFGFLFILYEFIVALFILMEIRVEFGVKLLSDHIFILLIDILIAYFFIYLRENFLILIGIYGAWPFLGIVRCDIYFSWGFFNHWEADTIIGLFKNTRALVRFAEKIIGIFGQFGLNPIFIAEAEIRIVKYILIEVDDSHSRYSPTSTIFDIHCNNIFSPRFIRSKNQTYFKCS